MTETNPLKNKRNPKIYVKLPSSGRYSTGILFTGNGEVPVRAMTARDEVLIRNPDALLNGDAVEQLIKSCVPEIENVRGLPVNDIDVILLAIKYATYGDKFDFSVNCPKCKTENKKSLGIRSLLDSATNLPEFSSVMLDDQCEVILKPYSFETSNKANLMDFESKKRLSYVQAAYLRVDGVDPKEVESAEAIARKEMATLFNSMADFSLNLMIESIIQINSIQGEVKTSVTNKEFIKDYVWDLDPLSVEKIKTKLKEITSYGVNKKTSFVCINPECNHTWDMEVGFDQSNFFEPTSVV